MTTSPPHEQLQQHAPVSLPVQLWRGAADAFVALLGWFLAMCALGVAVGALFIGVHNNGGWLTGFDGRVNDWFGLHHTGWTVGAAKIAADAGSVGGLAVITVVIGLLLWWIGWRVRAFVPFVAFLGAEATVYVVKEIIREHRPHTAAGSGMYPWVHGIHETDYSFPSGHTTATAAVVLALAVLAVSQGARWWPWFVAVVLAAGMATGRLILGVHWFADVAVGLGLGAMWGGAVAVSLREPDLRVPLDSHTGPG